MAITAAWAAKLDVAEKGIYIYWLTLKDAKGGEQATVPEQFKGKSGDIAPETLKGVTGPAKLFVMNKRTGNMAIADYAVPKDPKAAKPISLKASDFQYVRTVKLNVVSEDGARLASGIVNITDGEGTNMRAVLTPADEGVAAFHNVATGEISVKVAAKGIKKTLDSTFDLPEERKTAAFERDIKVSGDVDTLAVASKSKAGEQPAKSKSSGAGGILLTITGLLFVGQIIAIIYAVTKSRGATAESMLKKMGVQLPGEQPEEAGAVPAADAIDPTICPFCGQHKDAAGNCACSLGAAPASPYGASR